MPAKRPENQIELKKLFRKKISKNPTPKFRENFKNLVVFLDNLDYFFQVQLFALSTPKFSYSYAKSYADFAYICNMHINAPTLDMAALSCSHIAR